MKHEERIKFGKEYAKRLFAKYKDDLVYFGICGSTYRNEDRADSDIDAFVVTKSKKYWPSLNWPYYIYNGIAVSMGYYTTNELDRIIEKPDYKWPHRAYRTINSLPIYETYDLIGRYKEIIKRVDQQKFIYAATKQLTAALSCLSGIRKRARLRDLAGTRSGATLATTMLDETVALLNRGFLPSGGYGSQNLEFIAKYERIPKDYVRLSTMIWESANSNEIKNVVVKLLENTVSFAKENGAEILEYTSLSEIPV